MVEELAELHRKYAINPAGEGGEYESFVLDGPMFKKKIVIKNADKDGEVYKINDVELVEK